MPRQPHAVATFLLATGLLSFLIRWGSGEYAPWVNTYVKGSILTALVVYAVGFFIYITREPPRK
jgi:hypothetical protein